MTDSTKRTCRSKLSTTEASKPSMEFPSALYFQTHFEYIEQSLIALQQEVILLRSSLSCLEKIDESEACVKGINHYSKPYLNT